MQIVSARMCWRQATVRPLKSEAASAAPNEVVIGVVYGTLCLLGGVHHVHQFTGTAAVRPRPRHSGMVIPPSVGCAGLHAPA